MAQEKPLEEHLGGISGPVNHRIRDGFDSEST